MQYRTARRCAAYRKSNAVVTFLPGSVANVVAASL